MPKDSFKRDIKIFMSKDSIKKGNEYGTFMSKDSIKRDIIAESLRHYNLPFLSLFKGSDRLCKVVELRTQYCGKLL